MSEETTQNMPDGRSFEERVFARFDALDARLYEMDTRLSEMDARLLQLEQKSYDTKPIWERALAEILAVSQKLDTVERKLGVLGLDMLALRADQTRLEDRMEKLESKPAQ
jgi:chromosome segregation ATPase